MLNALIITALPVEFNAVKLFIQKPSKHYTPEGMIVLKGPVEGIDMPVSIVQIGYGNANSASETTRAVQFINPTHVVFVGIAGGLKEDVQIGDVVAADKVYGYSAGKSLDTFQVRPELHHPSYGILQEARHLVSEATWGRLIKLPQNAISREFKAFIKPIASGEEVVASTKSATYQLVKQHYGDALAVEMEGYGFHRALYVYPSIQYLAVRGISDLIDGKTASDAGGSHELASATAAAFVFALLKEINAAQNSSLNTHTPASITLTPITTVPDEIFWSKLLSITERLYPEGPEQLAVWERAGGEKSRLNLRQPGLTIWYQAIQLLRNGGGGKSLTAYSLLSQMKKDHPNDLDLQNFGNPQLRNDLQVATKETEASNRIRELILARFIAIKAKPNHVIDERWILQSLIPKLNPKEEQFVNAAIESLVNDGTITIDNRRDMTCLVLTENGYELLY